MSTQRDQARTLPIIWVALLMSVAIYGAIAWIAARGRAVEPGSGFSNLLVIVLCAAALGTLVASLVVSRIVASSGDARTPNAPSAYRPITHAAQNAIVIRWAMTEAVAIFGLVGAFVTGDWVVFVPFGVVGFFGILLAAPTDDRLRTMGPR